ncbi:hypothetical protein LEMLEM_LOCUS4407 [Lemmus lemmus]
MHMGPFHHHFRTKVPMLIYVQGQHRSGPHS